MIKIIKKFYQNDLNIDFVKYKKATLTISSFSVVVVLASMLIFGINFGIDFVGGMVIEASSKEAINPTKIRDILIVGGINAPIVQNFETESVISIKIKTDKNDIAEKIKTLLKNENLEYHKVEFVGAQLGKESIIEGLIAISLSFVGVLIYLLIRFNWKFAIAGIVGLIHDCIIAFFPFLVLNFEFNISSVAALLTIIGYSINDSVVIFDRIREKMRKQDKIQNLINFSINSTIFRSFLTSFTTLAALFPMLLFCTGEIKVFATVVFVGIIVGTYSSIFISSMLIDFGSKKTS